jgi:hypothetical protein
MSPGIAETKAVDKAELAVKILPEQMIPQI